ncbi:hypothetical protein ACIQW5_22745 [Methylorubrum thiocyanatum]|uniref:hypothetical protein n=1 Tax=Methylorubrum TaxID=2282523 RepID=UPI00197BC990
MPRLPFSDRLRLSLAGRVAPSRHRPAPLRFAGSTSPTLTLASLGLRIDRTGVPAGVLHVVKLIVDAVVVGRPDPASGVPKMDRLTDPGLRDRPIGQSTNDRKRRRGDGPDPHLQGQREGAPSAIWRSATLC